jgi:hypothetical protein
MVTDDFQAEAIFLTNNKAHIKIMLYSVVLSPLANYTDRRRSAKLVPTLADRGCNVVSATGPSDRNIKKVKAKSSL